MIMCVYVYVCVKEREREIPLLQKTVDRWLKGILIAVRYSPCVMM